MERATHGLGEAIAVNVIMAATLSLGTQWLITWLLQPLAGTVLAYLMLIISLLYFGIMGIRRVPVGWQGISLFFGKRVRRVYAEGYVWAWPEPIGDILLEDVRESTLEWEMLEVLTNNNVPVTLKMSAQYRVVDIFQSLSVNDPRGALQEAIDSVTRKIVQMIETKDVAQEKDNIESKIQGELSSYAKERWGIELIMIRVTSIRLPVAMEQARTAVEVMKAQKEKEVAQAEAEVTEAKNIAGLMKIFTAAGLAPEMAANLVQTERGKATRIIIDGVASPLEKAGALSGGIFNQSAKKAQATSSEPDTAPLNPRRRNQKRKE